MIFQCVFFTKYDCTATVWMKVESREELHSLLPAYMEKHNYQFCDEIYFYEDDDPRIRSNTRFESLGPHPRQFDDFTESLQSGSPWLN